MRLLHGNDEIVAQWVKERIPYLDEIDFGPCVAIGVVKEDGEPLAGVVFHDYQPQFKTIQVSVAAVSARWATHRILKNILAYPFTQLKVRKVWTATPHINKRALRFNKGIGFTQEAVLAYHFGDFHCVMCRMMDKDYKKRYLNG